MITRRTFLHATAGFALAATLRAQERTARKIVLRSSWQTVNIGDIAHTPGMLALFEKHRPADEITLWPSDHRPFRTHGLPRKRGCIVREKEMSRAAHIARVQRADASWSIAFKALHIFTP